MARGNRSTSSQGTQVIYLRLPKELVYLAECYQSASRLTTLNDAIRRLLETHPDLIARAYQVVYDGRDTSPKIEEIGTPS